MIKIGHITKKLAELNIPVEVLYNYDEPHRFYHNIEHILTMLNKAKERNILSDELYLAIVFHDIIYNPRASNNEEKSAELFYSYIQNDSVKQAILDTKHHRPNTDSLLSIDLCMLDLEIVHSGFEEFIQFEHKIFKEYQFVDYNTYKEKRIEVLESLGVDPAYIHYVRHRKPSIAVYAGSFNPFHLGHLNILEKAEQIFDKVIIARGVNPEKNNQLLPLPEAIQYRQVESYGGLLTDFVDSLEYDATVIRGLRNSADFRAELIQHRFSQDFKPNIKVVSIFCDREYTHISSSAIRQLKQFAKENDYLIK